METRRKKKGKQTAFHVEETAGAKDEKQESWDKNEELMLIWPHESQCKRQTTEVSEKGKGILSQDTQKQTKDFKLVVRGGKEVLF